MAGDVVEKIARLRVELGELFLHLRDRTIAAGIAFLDLDAGRAERLISSHGQMKEEITAFQEDCVVAIARYQPVARDLHDIMLLYRISYDVNRMEGLTLKVTKKTLKVVQVPDSLQQFNRVGMVDQIRHVAKMLGDCRRLVMDTQLKLSPSSEIQSEVKKASSEVAMIKRRIRQVSDRAIAEHPQDSSTIFNLFAIFRHYDRISDLTYSVCEEIMALRD